jgi:DNA-binding PadR family transcriptional regulator
MSLKYGLLGLLDDEPMTGYELMKLFNESLSFLWNAQTSQIYRDLGNLEDKGFLKSKIEQQSGKPDKRLYTITEKGRKLLTEWINDCDFSASLINKDSLLLKIFFSSKGDNEKLIIGLQKYILLNKERLESFNEALDTIEKYGSINEEEGKSSVYWRMTVSKGFITVKGNIEWAEECLDILLNKKN